MTTWTKRSSPSAIDWIETVTMKKDTDNFYKGFSYLPNGLVPAKQSSNFYFLAKVKESSGSFLLGKTVDNFMEAQPR